MHLPDVVPPGVDGEEPGVGVVELDTDGDATTTTTTTNTELMRHSLKTHYSIINIFLIKNIKLVIFLNQYKILNYYQYV